jgi:hypothetical protein
MSTRQAGTAQRWSLRALADDRFVAFPRFEWVGAAAYQRHFTV